MPSGLSSRGLLRGLFVPLVLTLSPALVACNTAAGGPQSIQFAEQHVVDVAPASHGPYILRPTDQLRVQVYNEPNVSGDYQIDSSGFVSIPLAGRVKAAGSTVAGLERSITSRLGNGLLKDPRVNVQIATYTPFYIHGEVKRSGEFPFRPGLTVMDAIASAGGFTYRADEKVAYVRRAGAPSERAYPLSARIPVHPGDNIRIAERFF